MRVSFGSCLLDTDTREVFVTEASLSSLVTDLRAVIGDDARGSTFIRTVHRHGYAFGGEPGWSLLAQRSRRARFID
jgi:DNA-binding winged helix-turn-helix (wHTH) protein